MSQTGLFHFSDCQEPRSRQGDPRERIHPMMGGKDFRPLRSRDLPGWIPKVMTLWRFREELGKKKRGAGPWFQRFERPLRPAGDETRVARS